jgi:hypothetical protein
MCLSPNTWEIILNMDIPIGSIPFEVFQLRASKTAEALVRYMRREGLCSERNQNFKINVVSNENCS